MSALETSRMRKVLDQITNLFLRRIVTLDKTRQFLESHNTFAKPGSSLSSRNGSVNAKSEPLPKLLEMERLDASLLKWLERIEETELNVSQANASISQKTAILQDTIILAQDNLSQDNNVGQQALGMTIDTAEEYYRVARQFNRVAGDVMCAGVIARQLVETIKALRLRDPTSLIGPMPTSTSISLVQEPGFITRQLAKLKHDLDPLSTRSNIISTEQVFECIAYFGPVMTLLSRQAIGICCELRRKTDEIDRLVRLITQSLITNATRRS